jgi:hypothetical protein
MYSLTHSLACSLTAQAPMIYDRVVDHRHHRDSLPQRETSMMPPLFRFPIRCASLFATLFAIATLASASSARSVPPDRAPSPAGATLQRPSPLKTFSTDRFSIQAPANWQVLDAKADAFILTSPNSATPQKQTIKLDVGVVPQSLAAAVKGPIGDEDIKLVKTERLTLNGHPAIRKYLEGGEYYDRAILTYIDNGRPNGQPESVYLSGFYYSTNAQGSDAVIAIQNSFKFR